MNQGITSAEEHILLKYPDDMRKEILKLASEYPYSIGDIEIIYLMGGYEHAKKLLDLKLRLNLNGYQLQLISNDILKKNYEESMKEFRNSFVKKDGVIKKLYGKIKYIWYRIQCNFYYEMKESLVDRKGKQYKKYENKYEEVLERIMKWN